MVTATTNPFSIDGEDDDDYEEHPHLPVISTSGSTSGSPGRASNELYSKLNALNVTSGSGDTLIGSSDDDNNSAAFVEEGEDYALHDDDEDDDDDEEGGGGRNGKKKRKRGLRGLKFGNGPSFGKSKWLSLSRSGGRFSVGGRSCGSGGTGSSGGNKRKIIIISVVVALIAVVAIATGVAVSLTNRAKNVASASAAANALGDAAPGAKEDAGDKKKEDGMEGVLVLGDDDMDIINSTVNNSGNTTNNVTKADGNLTDGVSVTAGAGNGTATTTTAAVPPPPPQPFDDDDLAGDDFFPELGGDEGGEDELGQEGDELDQDQDQDEGEETMVEEGDDEEEEEEETEPLDGLPSMEDDPMGDDDEEEEEDEQEEEEEGDPEAAAKVCSPEGEKAMECGADPQPGRSEYCCAGLICGDDEDDDERKRCVPAAKLCSPEGEKAVACGADPKPGRSGYCCAGLVCGDRGKKLRCVPAPIIVEQSYLQTYSGVDVATFTTTSQMDAYQTMMEDLITSYIDLDDKDLVKVECAFNTQRLSSAAVRTRRHKRDKEEVSRRRRRGLRGRDDGGDDGEQQQRQQQQPPQRRNEEVENEPQQQQQQQQQLLSNVTENEPQQQQQQLLSNVTENEPQQVENEPQPQQQLLSNVTENEPQQVENEPQPQQQLLSNVTENEPQQQQQLLSNVTENEPQQVENEPQQQQQLLSNVTCDTDEEITCADMCNSTCAGDESELQACRGQCRRTCCRTDDGEGGVGADGIMDPLSTGVLCPDGSPPIQVDPTSSTSETRCPTSAPSASTSSAPTTGDGPCDTDAEVTCRDLCLLNCLAGDKCYDNCSGACCSDSNTSQDEEELDPWGSGGILCPDGSVRDDRKCPPATASPTAQPTTNDVMDTEPQPPACTTNEDCKLFSNYCGGCNCNALHAEENEPTNCPEDTAVFECLVNPCEMHTAVCGDDGKCQIEEKEEEITVIDLVGIEGDNEAMQLEVDFTMTWSAESALEEADDDAILDKLLTYPGKFEAFMNTDRGRKAVLHGVTQIFDLDVESVSDVTPRQAEQ